jgi:hypothetical protein
VCEGCEHLHFPVKLIELRRHRLTEDGLRSDHLGIIMGQYSQNTNVITEEREEKDERNKEMEAAKRKRNKFAARKRENMKQ